MNVEGGDQYERQYAYIAVGWGESGVLFFFIFVILLCVKRWR